MHLMKPLLTTLTLAAVATQATTYDYVIAGAGTSGLLLALALTTDPTITVAVLEAGPDNRTDPRITVPEREGSIAGTLYDWNFTTTSQPGLYGGKSISVARGKVVGGTSAMNWMIWHRASAVEFDAWEGVLGIDGWNWDSVYAAAKASEKFTNPPSNLSGVLTYDDAFHGTAGPIDGTMAKGYFSLYDEYLVPTLKNLGVPIPVDRDGGNTTGAGYVPLSINATSYTRSYPGSSYTLAQARPNLHLITNALVTRIIWAPKPASATLSTAQGLAYINATSKSGPETLINGTTVILSAGTFQTPQLLELSGVGDPKILNPLGISTVVNLPAVGTKLADHPTFAASFAFNVSGFTGSQYAQNFQDYATPSRFLSAADWATVAQLLNSTGTAVPTGSSASALAMLKTLFFADEPLVEYGWFLGYVSAYLLHPLSVGTVHITSSSPLAAPAINPGYNTALLNSTTAIDLFLLSKAALYLARSLPATAPFTSIAAKYSVNASVPFAQFQAVVAQGLASGAHFTGGACMGPRARGGVVNKGLKVYGTANVMVVDLSVVPASPGQHPMGLAYAVAMRAREVLVG